jgi:hypothetical protein
MSRRLVALLVNATVLGFQGTGHGSNSFVVQSMMLTTCARNSVANAQTRAMTTPALSFTLAPFEPAEAANGFLSVLTSQNDSAARTMLPELAKKLATLALLKKTEFLIDCDDLSLAAWKSNLGSWP